MFTSVFCWLLYYPGVKCELQDQVCLRCYVSIHFKQKCDCLKYKAQTHSYLLLWTPIRRTITSCYSSPPALLYKCDQTDAF